MERTALGELRQPSMAGVLGTVVGPWGIWFVSIGLIVSVLGGLSGLVAPLAAEVLYSAAKASFVPNALGYENQNQVPSTTSGSPPSWCRSS